MSLQDTVELCITDRASRTARFVPRPFMSTGLQERLYKVTVLVCMKR